MLGNPGCLRAAEPARNAFAGKAERIIALLPEPDGAQDERHALASSALNLGELRGGRVPGRII
jgi:hypothetical protein